MNGAAHVHVAVACGGTGGHLFPGMAVASELTARGHDVSLLISPKDVDQTGVRGVRDMDVVTLPAVGLQGGNLLAFLRGAWKSRKVCRERFLKTKPRAVLAMGGFTSAPPILAGRSAGAVTFLHESNVIPGRANRWLAHVVDECFTGFPEGAMRLWHTHVRHTGTPVREAFQPSEPEGCRSMMGLLPGAPTLLVTGGSQGAQGLNELFLAALPMLAARIPNLQVIHLTGQGGDIAAKKICDDLRIRSVVRPFLSEMELALGAATLVVSRAGASSLAELAAMERPAVLVPFPAAADDHQTANARAAAMVGGAVWLPQKSTSATGFASILLGLLDKPAAMTTMAGAWKGWHRPDAASVMADAILQRLESHDHGQGRRSSLASKPAATISGELRKMTEVVG